MLCLLPHGWSATIELPVPQAERDDVGKPDWNGRVDEGSSSCAGSVEQRMDEFDERHHVGDGDQCNEGHADDAQARLLGGDTPWVGNEQDQEQQPFQGWNERSVSEASDEAFRQNQL